MGTSAFAAMLARFAQFSRTATCAMPRSFSTGGLPVASFVEENLLKNGFDSATASSEVQHLSKAGIVSMEVMKQLTEADWNKLGLMVGTSRVLQNALDSVKEGEALTQSGPKSTQKLSRTKSRSQQRL